MQVILSIKAGVLMPSTVLRKLGTYSHNNRLYRAFRELVRVVRTAFLLHYISDISLRRQITAYTNKAEAYHGFSKWLFFGGHGIIAHNDPIEQEKRIKYNDLVANAMILQNVVDMTQVLLQLKKEGYSVYAETLSILSPYLTGHIRRFGDYVLNMEKVPEPVEYTLLTA